MPSTCGKASWKLSMLPQDALALAREINPDEVPEFEVPEPEKRELEGGGTVYVYSLPGGVGTRCESGSQRRSDRHDRGGQLVAGDDRAAAQEQRRWTSTRRSTWTGPRQSSPISICEADRLDPAVD